MRESDLNTLIVLGAILNLVLVIFFFVLVVSNVRMKKSIDKITLIMKDIHKSKFPDHYWYKK
jgi:hypothetical protein